ncbi:MAG TPA: hypothetical protein VFO67_00010 [Gemmatimonadales bacterium]|nr:hypothetical protein [Gemmatimonadales bacterium]
MRHTMAVLALTILVAGLVPARALAQSGSPAPAATAAPYFAENSMNVFRRFNGDGRKTL